MVDGKQRLTAILRFVGKHPRALARVAEADERHGTGGELGALFASDYPRFRKMWKNLESEQLTSTVEREYYFPFKLRTGFAALQGSLQHLQGKYYSQIRDLQIPIVDDHALVGEIFEKDSTPYKVPLITYKSAEPRQIHEVFNLYNKQGKHLNAEEIRNAVYHDLEFMRALMVAAGDNTDVSATAPSLVPAWDRLEEISLLLTAYSFGVARYRRTKVLSWVASMLLSDSLIEGNPIRRTTALHIDSLLQRIESNPLDPLRSESRIRDAMLLMAQGLEAHSAVDEAWHPTFKNATGARWQELQLVGSVLGVTLAAVVEGNRTIDLLAGHADELRLRTASGEPGSWRRPTAAKTISQWNFIAQFALNVVDVLGVERALISATLEERFGFSCMPTLAASVNGDPV